MKAGDYVIYQNGDRYELGLIKRMRPDGGAFVYYHEGDTAAGTPKECLHEIANAYTIKETTLCALTKRVVTRRDYCSEGKRKDGADNV